MRSFRAGDVKPSEPHSSRPLRPPRVERMDPERVEVLRGESGAERLAMAFGMFRSARRMIASQLRAEHPEWEEGRLQREVARRIASGSG